MVPYGSCFLDYTLDTRTCEVETANNSKFFRCCVWVDYNTSSGVPVGMEDVGIGKGGGGQMSQTPQSKLGVRPECLRAHRYYRFDRLRSQKK